MPPPTDGGIAAYLEGLLRSPLVERFDLRPLDVRVSQRFRKQRGLRPLLTLSFLWKLEARLRSDRPHLVHIHSSSYAGFWEKALLAGAVQLHRVPFLMHLHGGNFDRFLLDMGPRQAALARRALRGARRVIVPSQSWRPLLEGFAGEGRVAVVPNAIHCEEFAPRTPRIQRGPVRLLFVGMVSPRKGLDDLLQAVRQLIRAGCRGFELHIVGGEEGYGQLEHYRRLFHSAGLGDWVRFQGMKIGEEKLAFFHEADVFVLPSRNESFGIANLEAMACGLPVVSTRTGAIPEYVESGVQGLLVEPGDVQGLATALEQLIETPVLRARLGEAARQRARLYDWSLVARQLAGIYAEATQGAP
jgi:glycosyltransferase involved in cell wall biosynthesis